MRLNNVRWPASDRRTKGLRDMHGITFARVVGVRVLALGMLTACVSAGQTLAAGGENGAERYRSLAGGVVIKKSAIALSPDALAQGKPSVRAEFFHVEGNESIDRVFLIVQDVSDAIEELCSFRSLRECREQRARDDAP